VIERHAWNFILVRKLPFWPA